MSTYLARVRAINQRWLATEGLDDETLMLKRRVDEIRALFPSRPSWWRPFARRQWDQIFHAVCHWALKTWDDLDVESIR